MPRLLKGAAKSALCVGLLALAPAPLAAQSSPVWQPLGDELYVGANYQPVDRSREQIVSDIALMEKAGFKAVRMGDLSWDYFEPADGRFDFAQFDFVMDEMAKAGIKVVLDIPGTPIPLWAHQAYPGISITADDGGKRHPADRYMDDISDPDFRRLQLRMADRITRHYARHPAVMAIGYSNEIGNGYMSYSEGVRQRFIAWLQKRHGSLEALNKAWAGQRWSRRVSDWQQVELPHAEGLGPSERYLDLRRFWSDATIELLRAMDEIRRKNVPAKPALSNLYDSAPRRGFDYLATQRDYQTYGAFGYYSSNPVDGAFQSLMIKGQLPTPVWYNEFQTGFFGDYGTPGKSRMAVYLGLLNGGQGFLAWTFNTHLGGEEQIYFGLLDHDSKPSWKLDEVGQVAREFAAIDGLGFPRTPQPQIALSYSFESRALADRKLLASYYRTPYIQQKQNAYEPIFEDNMDAAVVDLATADLSRYKLLIIAGEYLVDDRAARAIRDFVSDGGTAVMTAYSAKADETGQWHSSALPGGLSYVFGIRTSQFYQAPEALSGTIGGASFTSTINRYEVLEPSTARVLGRFSNVTGTPPVATTNTFGKGRAIYVAATAQPAILQPLYRSLYREIGIERGPVTPKGVVAREVEGRTLYVNTTSSPATIPVTGSCLGRISGRRWASSIQLEPFGVDLVE